MTTEIPCFSSFIVVLMILSVSAPTPSIAETRGRNNPSPPAVDFSGDNNSLATTSLTSAGGGKEWTIDDIVKLRDPFKRPHIPRTQRLKKTPLEKHSTSEYKMVGVIKGKGPTTAILIGPDKKTHFATKNMKIGTQNGNISEVTDDFVEVVEKISNILGRFDDQVTFIRLPPDIEFDEDIDDEEFENQSSYIIRQKFGDGELSPKFSSPSNISNQPSSTGPGDSDSGNRGSGRSNNNKFLNMLNKLRPGNDGSGGANQ